MYPDIEWKSLFQKNKSCFSEKRYTFVNNLKKPQNEILFNFLSCFNGELFFRAGEPEFQSYGLLCPKWKC